VRILSVQVAEAFIRQCDANWDGQDGKEIQICVCVDHAGWFPGMPVSKVFYQKYKAYMKGISKVILGPTRRNFKFNLAHCLLLGHRGATKKKKKKRIF
jgi:hypothetical protein